MKTESRMWVAGAAVIGAIGGALVTGSFNYFSHQNDLDGKMIELSVGILRATPTKETMPLREWAIDVLDKRARFSFTPQQRAVLLNQELQFRGNNPIVAPTATARERELDRALEEFNRLLPKTK